MNRFKKGAYQVIITIGCCTILYFISQYKEELKEYFYPTHYKSFDKFGIRIPTQYKTHGIDVSHHNGKINWELVEKMRDDSLKISFAFIKATEGTNYTDKRFSYNWKYSKKNKIIRGAYHYFNPKKKGLDQAKYFIRKVKLSKGDLPPVIDVEEIKGVSKATLLKEVKLFVKQVQAHYKVKPIIYTYHDFYKNYLAGEFKDYPLWIAHYHVKSPNNNEWNFWQHSDRGNVHGINTKVDFNVFNRNLTGLKAYLIK